MSSGADVSGSKPTRRPPGPPADDGPSLHESLAEAQTRGLDFPAAERATYIRSMVSRARTLRQEGKSVEQIRDYLPEFARDFPHLFEMVTENEQFDMGNLVAMLAMLDRMGQGEMSHHQATVAMGQRLAKKYIRPTGDEKGK